MKPALKLILVLFAILGVWFAASRLVEKPAGSAVPPPVRIDPTPSVPELLSARQSTPGNPSNSWERLLAADGTSVEDRAALEDILTNFLQSSPHNIRPPLGTNDEITRALTDRDTLGDSAIPANHPAIVSGELVDRWGEPWHFHQLAADVIEVRSAGPDRKPFTADDVVK
jgi:hypothetical protein